MFDNFYDDFYNGDSMRQQAKRIFDNINFEAETKDNIHKAIYSAVYNFFEQKVVEVYNSNKEEFDEIIKDNIQKVLSKEEVNFRVWHLDETENILKSAVCKEKNELTQRVHDVLAHQSAQEIRYAIRTAIENYVCEFIFPEEKTDKED